MLILTVPVSTKVNRLLELILILCFAAVVSRAMVAGQSSGANVATVNVSISIQNPTPLEPGFAGFNTALMAAAVPATDKQLASFSARLTPGWLRFPAGLKSDAYDWKSGLSPQSWVERFSGSVNPVPYQLGDALQVLSAKGGERVDDASLLASRAGAKGLIVCVNVFTDTPTSAGEFAAYAKSHGIKVLTWQLGNEPTMITGFFSSATDYAEKVRPFAEAIRAADSSAKVSVSMGIAGQSTNPALPQQTGWDNALATFQPRYWNSVTYHHYPRFPTAVLLNPDENMANLNQVLAVGTTGYVNDYVAPLFGKMPVISASLVYQTSLSGGATARLPGGQTIPAVYGQAYNNGRGFSLLVTNKSDRAEVLAISVNGRAVNSRFQIVTATGPSFSARNKLNDGQVVAKVSTASQLVSIPGYSVVRISW